MWFRKAALAAAAILLPIYAAAQQPGSTPAPATTSFRYAGAAVTSFAANATDWLVITGSATKKVTITNISLCGLANAPTTLQLSIIKRSTADSGGTSSPATALNLDGNNIAATSSVVVYTVNPSTLGTSAGVIDTPLLNLGVAGGAGCTFLDYGTRGAGAPVLRGASQQLAVNLGSVSVPAGTSINWRIEVVEQ